MGFGVYPAAQSAYVAGAIGADVSRASHTDSTLYATPGNGAEVLSGALRVGTSVGTNWGVELEFARSGRTSGQGLVASPLALAAGVSGTTQGGINIPQLPVGVLPGIPTPVAFDYRSDSRTRHSSIDAVAWARQAIGGRADLVYLGGVAFTRDRSDLTETITPLIVRLPAPQTFHSSFITYATRPVVGMEARIKFSERLRLVPGFRVQGLGDGWLMRPYVGLGWFF